METYFSWYDEKLNGCTYDDLFTCNGYDIVDYMQVDIVEFKEDRILDRIITVRIDTKDNELNLYFGNLN